MEKLVNFIQETRNKVLASGMAKKFADNFEQKALETLSEWFRDNPSRAIAYNIFSFHLGSIVFDDEVSPTIDFVVGYRDWQELEDVDDEYLVEISENQNILIALDESFNSIVVKDFEPFINELYNRGYKVLYYSFNNTLCVNFGIPR